LFFFLDPRTAQGFLFPFFVCPWFIVIHRQAAAVSRRKRRDKSGIELARKKRGSAPPNRTPTLTEIRIKRETRGKE
jgi:hypothetical protein